MNYTVKLKDGRHVIEGLTCDQWRNHKDTCPDTLLIVYDAEGNPETYMRSAHMMLKGLHEVYQTEYGLKWGDTFDTVFGKFTCISGHVMPAFIMPDKSEAEMIANQKRMA